MSRSMRVMLVTDAVGGVWNYSLDLARALRQFDVEAVLALMGPSPSNDQRREASGFDIVETDLPLDWLAEHPRLVRRAGSELAKIANREGVDLVQTNSAALLADSDFDQPVIAVQHSCVASWWRTVRSTRLPRDFAWRRDLVECGLHRASAVTAPSAAFAALTVKTYALSRPVHAVHNGRRALPMKRRPVENFVFTAGRLWDDGKNARVLDEAAGHLGIPVEAAGPLQGPNGTAVSFDNLKTPGELSSDAIADRLAARPIFATAALYEPFGLSALEAAQAGCALVLSDIPTFRELWADSALFVPADDPKAFAQAVQSLVEQPELREELGLAARIRALRYTPDRMAERMARLYAGLVPQRREASEAEPVVATFQPATGAA